MTATLLLRFSKSDPPLKITSDEEVLVGRAASCDVDLTPYFEGHLQAVSRQHFKLFYRRGEGFFIVDISYNGTEVNNENLTKNQPRILRDNDIIRLARNEYLMIGVTVDDDPDTTDAIVDPEMFFQAAGSDQSGLYFDAAAVQFVVDGHLIPHELLTKLDVTLLTYLCQNIDRLCSFDDIAAHVWDDPAWTPENNTISRAVTNLRKKLDQFLPGAGNYIQNIRGQGYKLGREKS